MAEGIPNLARLADEFAIRPAHERLTARVWLEGPVMDVLYQLVHTRSRTIAVLSALNSARAPAYALDSALASASASSAHNLASYLDSDLVSAHSSALALSSGLAYISTLDFDSAYGLVPAFASYLDSDLARDLDSARGLARGLARDLDSARGLARGITRDLDSKSNLDSAVRSARAIYYAVNRARSSIDTLDRVLTHILDTVILRASIHTGGFNLAELILTALRRNTPRFEDATVAKWDAVAEPLTRLRTAAGDMVGADLRTIGLEGIPLDGVRWSASTRWPQALRKWVTAHSEQIGPDLYQIQDRHDSNDRTTILTG